MLAAILTIGNEVVSGDVTNTNATWLAQRPRVARRPRRAHRGVPDEIGAIAEFIRRERGRVDHLIVTGGLGGTPDDLTREALAAAFEVPQEEVPELAAELRQRFTRHPDYAARWAQLPAGSRPLTEPARRRARLPDRERLGAAGPAVRDGGDVRRLRRGAARRAADLVVAAAPTGPARATSSTCSPARPSAGRRSASAPTRASSPTGPEVEIVLKSADAKALAEAVAWLEPELDAGRAARPGRRAHAREGAASSRTRRSGGAERRVCAAPASSRRRAIGRGVVQ